MLQKLFMMGKKRGKSSLFGFLLASCMLLVGGSFSHSKLEAFEKKPWIGTLMEFHFIPSYTFSHYPSVNNATTKYSSSNNLIDLSVLVSPFPSLDVELTAGFAKTRMLSWGGRNVGLQLRYQLLDDIAGDAVSLTLGANTNYVPSRNLADPSSPFHSIFNIELNASVGKEYDQGENWLFRYFAFLGIGQGNQGAPYFLPNLTFAFNYDNSHVFLAKCEGYFGLGHKREIIISDFSGYANYAHKSIDVAAAYKYNFRIWGSISVEYARRVYASTYPQYENIGKITYDLPFSLL